MSSSVDLDRIRAMDAREVARQLMGEPVRSNSRYVVYRSPLRDDGRTPSFTVYADGWKDFGGGHDGGDVISLVMAVQGVDFRGALEWFGATPHPPTPSPTRGDGEQRRNKPDEGPPDAGWQAAAMDVVIGGERTLWSVAGARALRYLREVRGLSEAVIREARLGYVPGGPRQWRKLHGLNVPCGVVIPWMIDGDVWALKVRRAAGKPKYMQVADGSSAGLYQVDRIQHFQDVMVTEGEFDALVVNQSTRLVTAVALGSASNTIRERWLARLVTVPRIYARLDADESGLEAARRLQSLSARVRPVQVPEPHKDINDYWLADPAGFGGWVRNLEAYRAPSS